MHLGVVVYGAFVLGRLFVLVVTAIGIFLLLRRQLLFAAVLLSVLLLLLPWIYFGPLLCLVRIIDFVELYIFSILSRFSYNVLVIQKNNNSRICF